MDVAIEEDYIIFKIKNDVPEKNLIPFYTPEYFKFIGIEPEIFISGNNIDTKIESESESGKKMGGYFQDENLLTVPYKYFVYLVEKNPLSKKIKTISFPKFPNIPKSISKEPSPPPKSPIKEPINSKFIQTLFKKTQEPIKPPHQPPTESTQPHQPPTESTQPHQPPTESTQPHQPPAE